MVERVTVSMDDDLLEQFDRYIEAKGYANRSEGIRDAVRHLLAHEKIDHNEDGKCVGCAVYVYSHKERTLSSRLMETQHHHHHIPTATLHTHIDSDFCLEATVLNGSVSEVRRLGDQIISQTGVRHGRVHIIPVDDSNNKD